MMADYKLTAVSLKTPPAWEHRSHAGSY